MAPNFRSRKFSYKPLTQKVNFRDKIFMNYIINFVKIQIDMSYYVSNIRVVLYCQTTFFCLSLWWWEKGSGDIASIDWCSNTLAFFWYHKDKWKKQRGNARLLPPLLLMALYCLHPWVDQKI